MNLNQEPHNGPGPVRVPNRKRYPNPNPLPQR